MAGNVVVVVAERIYSSVCMQTQAFIHSSTRQFVYFDEMKGKKTTTTAQKSSTRKKFVFFSFESILSFQFTDVRHTKR